jgi:hypothetical protein
VVSGKEHVPVGQLIETCTEKCPNISQEIEDKPSSICNGVENVECEESLSHNTEEATFSGNSEVFVTSELLNKFSYPTSTRRHGNFAGVHTLLRIILSSNSAVIKLLLS